MYQNFKYLINYFILKLYLKILNYFLSIIKIIIFTIVSEKSKYNLQ